MNTRITPDLVLTAFLQMEAELPELIGMESWQALSDDFNDRIQQLKQSSDPEVSLRISADLIDLIAPYQQARVRFWDEVQQGNMQRELLVQAPTIETELANLAAHAVGRTGEMGTYVQTAAQFIDLEPVDTPSTQRLVSLEKSGIGEAKSIKFKNFKLDLDQLIELAPGIGLSIGKNILGEDSPILIVAGLLLIVRSLIKAMTVTISEQEVSVFWGFIQACDAEKTASQDKILQKTNTERAKIGLDPLTDNQVKNSLFVLASMKSVQALEGQANRWRIVERYHIRD